MSNVLKVMKAVAINIRNPLVIERVVSELQKGRGRNLTEIAENLIVIGADARRRQLESASRRARKSQHAA